MSKVTPDPPETDNPSAHQSPNPEKTDKANDRDVDDAHFSLADIKAIPRTPCSMYIVNPEVDVQTLLGSASESLASASVIIMDVADRETGTSRNSLLGVAEIILLTEIKVNRALDQLDSIE